MDSARGPAPRTGSWDAAGFLRVWRRLDPQGRGYLDDKELDAFCRQMLTTLGTDPAGSDHPMAKGESGEAVMDENVQKVKQQLVASHDLPQGGPVRMDQLARVFLSEDENFLLLFRQESPLDSSVEFMQIWRKYDADRSGFISAAELQNFLRDLLLRRRRPVSEAKLEEYAGAMMKVFDRNQDGRLDLSDLARILALQENFLLQFKMDACSTEERKRDFEKIFAHYDVSETGALEGPEVDGFVKDMMELVQPSVRGVDLERFRESLLRHCDANGDGKIQKSELALCLGLRSSP